MASRSPLRPNIVVVCPVCGHRQDEPRLVVSTICRRCLTHVEVRDGVVVGPFKPATGPAFGPPPDQRPPAPEEKKKPGPGLSSLRIRKPDSETPPEPTPAAAPPALPPGLRIRTHSFAEEPASLPAPAPTLPPTLRIRTHPVEDDPPPPPAPPLALPPTLRLRSRPPEDDPAPEPGDPGNQPAKPRKRRKAAELLGKWLRPAPPKRAVLCVECGREFQAPAAAETTNCPTCGCHMSLRDFLIQDEWDDRIETRGNVTVLRKGKLSGPTVLCHHLTLRGPLETGASCSGHLAIQLSTRFRTKLRCAKLLVQKRARVEFIHPVETGEAVIDGTVTGSIRATGPVTLLKRSRLRGNITTSQLILKQGAIHTGTLRIVQTTDPETPPNPPG